MGNTLQELAKRICCAADSGKFRDGIICAMAVYDDGRNEYWPQNTDDRVTELMCCMANLGLVIPAKSSSQNAIASLAGSSQKLRVEIFKGLTIVVMFKRAHRINKSMERIIRHASRRYGFERVESRSCSAQIQSDKQPAPLSEIPTGAF